MIEHRFVFFLGAGALLCVLLLVGGWVEGALRRPWWVGGPFRTLVFFRPEGDDPFLLFIKYRPPTGG